MTTTSAPVEGVEPPAATSWDWRLILAKLGPVIGLIFVYALFALLKPATFLTSANAEVMLLQTAVVGTAALGMTLIIISGGIDLSVGSAIALCTVAIAMLLNAGLAPALAIAGGVGVGAMAGICIGAMVIGHVGRVFALVAGAGLAMWLTRGLGWPWWFSGVFGVAATAAVVVVNEMFVGRIPLAPFIVTLGTWGAYRGLAKFLADETMVAAPRTWLNGLLQGLTPATEWMILPIGVWIMLAMAVAVALALRYTRFGRHVFAIGSNEQTARLCGVSVERSKLLIYVFAGALAGLAGVLQFSYLTVGDPTTATGMELDIIAAVVIGGASLSGGQGSVIGTLLGALIMTVVSNGCTKVGLSNSVQEIVTGGIIILAVAVDRVRQKGS
jgi:ribose/xylose/arabinose/galactoside ABC-type transport system permease subunit